MNIKPVQLIINELKNSIIHKHFNYPVINHMMSTLYNFLGSLVFFINNVSSLIIAFHTVMEQSGVSGVT